MVEDAVRDVIGVIAQVTGINQKMIKSKKDGKEYALFNVGIRLDDDSWHNVSGFKEEKVLEVLDSQKLARKYQPGDYVKIYEDSKDGKFWNIKAIVAMDGVAQAAPAQPVSAPTREFEPEPAPYTEEVDMRDAVESAQPKDIKKVTDFKIQEGNMYLFGQCLNNAAVILTTMITKMEDVEADKIIEEVYPVLVENLYLTGQKLREKILGY